MAHDKYIRFDWAAKKMLCAKANFDVLEGLFKVLIGEEIKIIEIIENESNQDKYNRVDIKAKDSKGDIIIVEIQQTREYFFLERLLYGVSKSIVEHISLGETYEKVKKVYCISILYFDLGKGADYLYHGQTKFVGVHTHDTLQISTKEQDVLKLSTPEKIFPEYYLIRVNEFNQEATTPLEEWIEYLKTGKIKEDTNVPGLGEARKKMQYMMMDDSERISYDNYINDVMIYNDIMSTSHAKGLAEGLELGMKQGMEKAKKATAQNLKSLGTPIEIISKATGLTIEEIEKL